MRAGQEVKQKTETAEKMRLKASKEVNADLRSSLIDPDSGLFRPGSLPKVEGASASASKALMSSFGQATSCETRGMQTHSFPSICFQAQRSLNCFQQYRHFPIPTCPWSSLFRQVAAAPKKAPKQKAEKILASSWAGQAKERQETLLHDAAKARTSSIALGSIEYASELSKQLLEHATKLENFYKKIDQAIQQDASEGAFKAIMIKIREGDAFGERLRPGCFHSKSFHMPTNSNAEQTPSMIQLQL